MANHCGISGFNFRYFDLYVSTCIEGCENQLDRGLLIG